MKGSVLASVALLGAFALADEVGSAVVTNGCEYDVYLFDVPAAGGGKTDINEVLSPGQTFSQQWTTLTNNDGWSIKLSKSTDLSNIMQYEYTWQNEGTIWYDLSDVNGNPWNGDWEITSNEASCVPKQQAYRYSTDDAYGEQSCPGNATITVLLCSGESQNNGTSSSASSSVAAESSTAASTSSSSTTSTSAAETTTTSSTSSSTVEATTTSPTSTTAETSSTTSAATSYTHHWGAYAEAAASASSTTALSSTTFATSTTAAIAEAGTTVYEVETAVVTEVVTALYTPPSRIKRHEHHAGHHHA